MLRRALNAKQKWPEVGTPIKHGYVNMEPIETLIWYDGPMIYTCKSYSGKLMLAYCCDTPEKEINSYLYLVAPISEENLKKFLDNEIPIYSMLDSNPLFLIELDVTNDDTISTRLVSIDDIPTNHLPERNVKLQREATNDSK